ncbi:uncharacterized protein BP5553_07842 [Venustampulla echinocandica]|uniref:Heterokaryon incompatibility domain-containing protein n=1 Tax=Venustampulla echinocandica TaxID=2656787 RepID=A0A370THP0_9HELO|nr:uncharacterized protein BP5553_07842 [Venustampulla echinocandica]RDL34714.1 hypothetical protein BP5553_07842 [Venustampulla echinocandica]
MAGDVGETTHTNPVYHSCEFCKKFVIDFGLKDKAWIARTFSSDMKSLGSALQLHSTGIKGWLKERTLVGKIRRPRKESLGIIDWPLSDLEGSNRAEISINRQDGFLAAQYDYDKKYPFRLVLAVLEQDRHKRREFQIYNFSSFTSDNRFDMIAPPGNITELEMKIFTRPMNLTPSSSESFQLARSWFRNCLDTHLMCPKPTSRFMPKRVIEVLRFDVLSQNHSLRLCERLFENGEPYAALSYCWGTEGQIVTKYENIAQHLERIDTQLPATVTDALRIAVELGIRYVWIDALCIIQDDFHDKIQEISQMPLVYSQATVTIVASRARCVQEGFLYKRTSSQNVFKLPCRCPSGQTGAVLLQPWIETCREPLDSRAWALQERLLSPRVLDYGSFQTRWICKEYSEFQTPTDRFRAMSTYQTMPTITKSQPKTEVLEQWHSLVTAFTHRDLTLPTDRLPAISGIATRFSNFLGEYYAGLWKSYLWQELFWCCDHLPDPAPKPKVSQAPSWSWAATNSMVNWLWVGNYKTDPSFEILDNRIHLVETKQNMTYTEAKFGAVSSGTLVVRGHLQPAAWVPWWGGICGYKWWGGDQYLQGECLHAIMHYDIMEEEYASTGGENQLWRRKTEVPGRCLSTEMHPYTIGKEFAPRGERNPIPVFLLKVAHIDSDPGDNRGFDRHIGLVLRQTDNGEYSRLGVFQFEFGGFKIQYPSRDGYIEQLRWLEENEPQIITII